MSSDEAGEAAVSFVKSLQPSDFPYGIEVNRVYAATYSQLASFHKILRSEEMYSFKTIPGKGDVNFGGDGLYRVDIRFTYGGTPMFSHRFEESPRGTVFPQTNGARSMDAQVVVSEQGIIYLSMDYIYPSGKPHTETIISIQDASRIFAQTYSDLAHYEVERTIIDEIKLIYMSFTMNSGEYARQIVLQPVWCFTDNNPRGFKRGDKHDYMINALSGEKVKSM